MFLLLLGVVAFVVAVGFYLFGRYSCVTCDSNVYLLGKTALVTGGSSGIGYQVALSLLARGCRVIIADIIINEDIKTAIINETHNPNVVLEYVDFSSFKSIRNFAEKLRSTEEKLDILINNVGIGKCNNKPTEDGLNLVMQINHYSPFLLTYLLIELLKKSNGARIIFTSSGLSFMSSMVPFKLEGDTIKLTHNRNFDYIISKLCTVVVSDIFAEKLKKFNIKSNTYHPGMVKTDIFKTVHVNFNIFNIFDVVASLILNIIIPLGGQTPKRAAQTAVNLAVSEQFENVTGTFFGVFFPKAKPLGCNDKDLCQKIWEASECTVKLKPHEKL